MTTACPLCRGQRTKLRHRVAGFDYMACLRCGAVFLWPFPDDQTISRWYADRSYFEQESGNSGYVDYEFLREGFLKTFRRRNRLLGADFFARPRRVLEVGCALGYFPLALKDRPGVSYLGLDLNPYAVEAVKAQGFDAQCLRLEELRDSGSYDLLVLFDVLEHLPSPRPFLSHAKRVLKKDGRLMLTTPCTTSFLSFISGARWVSYIVPHHIYLYRPSLVRRLLKEAGFSRITCRADVQWVPGSFLNQRLSTLLPPLKALQPVIEKAEASGRPWFIPVPNGNMLVTARA